MKEIAQRRNVDDASLIQDVINGIPDTPNNKAVIPSLSWKISSKFTSRYDQSSKFHQPKSSSTYNTPRRNQRDKATKIICFNCGVSDDHMSNKYTYKNQMKRCFSCLAFGHQCTARSSRHKHAIQGTYLPQKSASDRDNKIHVIETQQSWWHDMRKYLLITTNMPRFIRQNHRHQFETPILMATFMCA